MRAEVGDALIIARVVLFMAGVALNFIVLDGAIRTFVLPR
ncbi:MAG: hypothetical protein QOF28_2069, partial [Actinomycetota bacterium]|nr:hypothetical protein [Actinomycetota bacterium]